ncbi:tripartite motif-containing protein 16-like [Polypterus senegalus]|uniref:tripartite motif-containing protein 16-like n=1 Tax=Polypterus senegalus TaxID=55291 RepID=UPI001965CDD4|nr:tripartite motif-containing protein 16-like [Polypterus senegalus]
MAAAHRLLSADQYCCSVCLDVLKEPVSLTCGHNYCLDCINGYWDISDEEGIYNCPLCNQTFNVRPVVKENVMVKDLIAQLNDIEVCVSPYLNYSGPDDVPCDVCTGRRLRAVKSCLTCMASYCETHLQPHRQSEAFNAHKLEEPTGNLEEKICTKHQKVLEVFCRTNESCICLLCMVTEHKSHDTVTPEEERAERQNQLDHRKAEIKKRIEEKEKKLERMKETVARIQNSADSEMQEHEDLFLSVLQSIERLRSEITKVIRDHESREVRKAEKVIDQLEMEIMELKRRDAKLAKLSQTEDHILFLKMFPSICDPPQDEDSPDIKVNGNVLPEMLRKDLVDLKKSLEEIVGWEFVKTNETGIITPRFVLSNLNSRNNFLQYICTLTLDPNTANRRLRLSEKNKKVTDKRTVTPYPKHPDRFGFWPQVLCREALSGTRWYWEVQWSGERAAIGVAYKGIERKGHSDECPLGSNDKSWCLFCSDSSYFVQHDNKEIQLGAHGSHRIGVYLDWPAGLLSFYSISYKMILLHSFNASFTEPLYPGFWVGPDSSVTICDQNPFDQ